MVRSFSHAFYGIAALLSFVDAKEPDITWSTPSQQQSLSSTDDDEGVIAVGIVNPRPICDAESGIGCSVGVKILSALEADELLTGKRCDMFEVRVLSYSCPTLERNKLQLCKQKMIWSAYKAPRTAWLATTVFRVWWVHYTLLLH